MSTFILPLSDPKATLETAGGKGMSLAKLAKAGLPVPGGFHVTTEAYRQFVAVNGLQPRILETLAQANLSDPAALEPVSTAIRGHFTRGEIAPDLAADIVQAYAALPGLNPAVAVRSSATAEDLPEASFAGQQETYLNVSGADAVLEAVRKCWASLWTGRAIAYRLRQKIAPESVALAVVIQLLVPAEAAGVLFTANPLNGKRNEAVINAAWGMGEAVVGGLVTPDTITVDKFTERTIRRETAEKRVMTVRTESGTTEQPVPDSIKNVPVLSDAQVTELTGFGTQIEALYQTPMDIEWALADGKFAILQARPITALGEAPLEWKPPKPKGIYMRASVVDLLPDPVSPLFASLGIPALIAQMVPLGKYLMRSKPVLPDDYFTTINSYAYMNAAFSPKGWWWIVTGMVPSFPRMLRIMLPYWRDEVRPQYRTTVANWQGKALDQMNPAGLWQVTKELMDATASYTCTLMFATMGASAGSEGLLTKLYEKMARQEGDPPATALLMGWDNIPARAEKSLYDLATFCRERERLSDYVLKTPSKTLTGQLASDRTPAGLDAEDWHELCQRFNQHLQQFGHMIYELDFAKPLPIDYPEPMLETVKMYLRGEGVNPHERQQASEAKRKQTAEAALGRLKGIRRWAFVKALKWAQSLSEVREDALADIGLGYPLLRQALRELGSHFVKAGALAQAEDIFWLEKVEIESSLAELERGARLENQTERVEHRKAFWQRAKQMTPPPIIPPRKKYLGFSTKAWVAETEDNQASNTLKGVAASPGKVTAPACVLRGPEDFTRMKPGEVLVAGTTTPAWTPLFAMASAVVTDIGGPLSHGSIVAREYGIPAVMGTGVATRRIQSGQTVTVDGNAGIVTIASG